MTEHTRSRREHFVQDYVRRLSEVLARMPAEDVGAVIEHLERAYQEDRRVFVIGNGGSAATASHMACDLGKTILPHPDSDKRFQVLSLVDNTALFTALANDFGYDHVFSQQIKTHARAGDLLIAISGRGNSPNLLEALRVARDKGVTTIGFLGFGGGKTKALVDTCVLVKSDSYGFVEDAHMVLDHLITSYFQDHVTGVQND